MRMALREPGAKHHQQCRALSQRRQTWEKKSDKDCANEKSSQSNEEPGKSRTRPMRVCCALFPNHGTAPENHRERFFHSLIGRIGSVGERASGISQERCSELFERGTARFMLIAFLTQCRLHSVTAMRHTPYFCDSTAAPHISIAAFGDAPGCGHGKPGRRRPDNRNLSGI